MKGLYILMINIHGLTRGHNLELGFDSDTGGQTKYVIELARALSKNKDVGRINILTRQFHDPNISLDYAQSFEEIADKTFIVRIPCGPRRYLRKEALWPHLDAFADQAVQYIKTSGLIPDVIHSHYADAGYVGEILAGFLGDIPLVFTGHSLGRIKKQSLLDKGQKEKSIESKFNITRRIEAEETTLGAASFVVASTYQEISNQYNFYDRYNPNKMVVIPPGFDLNRFQPPDRNYKNPKINAELNRFFANPKKPIILALSRPDERKNIATLVKAYAKNKELRALANLALVIGTRDNIKDMDKGSRNVITNIIMLIDKYDLYGSIAYPKYHAPEDVPELYRLASKSKGVFVNPALTEPFGLTIIEAAASGLPVVATRDGGCKDIITMCQNGKLVDPLNHKEISNAILEILTNTKLWAKYSKNGVIKAYKNFTWESHVKKYLGFVKKKIDQKKNSSNVMSPPKDPLLEADQLLVCDIDNTLIGDRKAHETLLEKISSSEQKICLTVATGRHLKSTIKVLQEWNIPIPDLLITSVGSEIYYNHGKTQDKVWKRYIDHNWNPQALQKAMLEIPGIKIQVKDNQRDHKLSYNVIDLKKFPKISKIVSYLRKQDLHANVIYSHEAYVDLLPVRASKGMAIRYVAIKWGLLPENILVAGDSGNDLEMLRGSSYGVVVGNHSPELEKIRGDYRVYFAKGHYAWGILEAIEHYNFLKTKEEALCLQS